MEFRFIFSDPFGLQMDAKSKVKSSAAPPRFHGAFTGGFSAGYFNTVGSEEGFQPKKFVSSRNNRNVNHSTNAATDYMDEEDGLLGGVLRAKQTYDTFDEKISSHVMTISNNNQSASDSLIPGPIPTELIATTSRSAAKGILKKMGWKEGHGIGAPVLYTVPGKALLTQVSVPIREQEQIIIPPPKSDTYGIGYINTGSLSALVNRTSSKQKSNHSAVSHVGVRSVRNLNDDDDEEEDNVYDNDLQAQSNEVIYDDDLYSDSENDQNESSERIPQINDIRTSVKQWVADSTTLTDEVPQQCPTDGRPVLSGFSIGAVSQLALNKFPIPILPPDFKLYTKPQFTRVSDLRKTLRLEQGKDLAEQEKNRENRRMARRLLFGNSYHQQIEGTSSSQMNATQSIIDSERNVSGPGGRVSVFEYMSEESSRKLRAIAASLPSVTRTEKPSQSSIMASTVATPSIATPSNFAVERPYLTSELTLKNTFAGVSNAFKDRFVSSSQSAVVTNETSIVGLTSSSKHAELVNQTNKLVNKTNVDEPIKAIKAKRSRISTIWIPDALLCKRFNVPVPDIASSTARHLSSLSEPQSTGTSIHRLLHTVTVPNSEPMSKSEVPDIEAESAAEKSELDEYTAVRARPALSLFKSIFEDSDNDEDEAEETKEKEDTDRKIEAEKKANHLPIEEVISETKEKQQPEKILFRKPAGNIGEGGKRVFSRVKPTLVVGKDEDDDFDEKVVTSKHDIVDRSGPRQNLLSFEVDASVTGMKRSLAIELMQHEVVPISAVAMEVLVKSSEHSVTNTERRSPRPPSPLPPVNNSGEYRSGYPTLTADTSFSKALSLLEASLGDEVSDNSSSSSDSSDDVKKHKSKKHKPKKEKKKKKKDKKEKKEKKDKKRDV